LDDELAEINRQTELAKANAQLREVKATGVAHLGHSLVAAARGSEDKQDLSTRPPDSTGPGSPAVAESPAPIEEIDEETASITPLPKRTKAPRQLPAAARATRADGLRKRAFQLLERDSELSVNSLAKTLGCRWTRADQLKREFLRSRSTSQVAL
jgi:hypothetical protein